MDPRPGPFLPWNSGDRLSGKRVTFHQRWLAILLILPQLLLVFTFFYWPAGKALYWAFTLEPPFGGEQQWVGWQNFETVFVDPLYWNSVTRSILFAVCSAALAMGMGLLLALFVDRQLAGFQVYRFICFWP